MKSTKRMFALVVTLAVLALAVWAAETKLELTKKLWPKERVVKALKDVEKQKADGLITPKMYERKTKMLKARLAGNFTPTMLATTNPPLNLLRNASFEDFNRNTKRNMSRWNWWGGWAWPATAAYQNDKEDRPEYVKGGKLSARFKSTGKVARTGIRQTIPLVEGATGYELTIWARGEGNNMLHIAFEAGADGNFREQIGNEWQKITVTATPKRDAKKFSVWIYIRGGGTIWLDEARMLPLGVKVEE